MSPPNQVLEAAFSHSLVGPQEVGLDDRPSAFWGQNVGEYAFQFLLVGGGEAFLVLVTNSLFQFVGSLLHDLFTTKFEKARKVLHLDQCEQS